MALGFPATITGSAQTGFTSPTYGLVADSAPDQYGLQRAVSVVGGTQAGVDAHSTSRPFTLTWVRPRKMKVLAYNPTTQLVIRDGGNNVWHLLVRKGMTVAPNQPPRIGWCKFECGVPAGADINDPACVRAMVSACIGEVTAWSAEIGNTGVSGLSWGA